MAEQTTPVAPPISAGSRLLAFLTYLLGPIGWIIALLFGRKNLFATFHLRQSIGVFGALLIGTLTWLAISYAITIIPYFGPLIAFALFALVIALFLTCLVLWIMGMVNALRGKYQVLPLVGLRIEKWVRGYNRNSVPADESSNAATHAELTEQAKG